MNFDDALMTVQLIIDSGAVPLIVGESGIGKTSLAKALSERNNYYIITIEGNLLKEGEIGGLPIVEEYTTFSNEKPIQRKKTVYAVHHKLEEIERALRDDPNRKVLLFIDEINRCEHTVQQELMNIILNREINGFILPSNTVVLAAMNPPSKYNTFAENQYQVVEMDPAQENRFVWVELEVDVTNWLQWGKNNIVEEVLNFISLYPQYLHRSDSQELVKATPRSWERVSKSYEIFIKGGRNIPKKIFYNVVKGNVGAFIAQEFLNFIESKDSVILDASKVLETASLSEDLISILEREKHEKLYLFALNCISEINKSSSTSKIAVFSKIIQYYPPDLRLAIMKKIKSDIDRSLYEVFLNQEEFIEAYFSIYK
jgi:MoxR-like ATPase